MNAKWWLAGLVVVVAAVGLWAGMEWGSGPTHDTGVEADSAAAPSQNKQQGAAARNAAAQRAAVAAMSLEERRAFYKDLLRNEPYRPITEVLDVLDQGLVDEDVQVRRVAVGRFVKSYYKYGSQESSKSFNQDDQRKQVFLSLLEDPDPYLRAGVVRVLAQSYAEQEEAARAVAAAIAEERVERLQMIRAMAAFMRTHPSIARGVLMEEVITGGGVTKDRATPVESAYILSETAAPPTEILEPVMRMLEGSHFGDPLLLRVLRNYGPLAKPYLERLKRLQVEVDRRIRFGRDDGGRGSSTFSREEYGRYLEELGRS